MKSMIAALIIAAALIGGGLYSSFQLNMLTNELTDKNKTMLEYIDNEDYAAAYIQLKEIDRLMQGNELILASYLNHDELDTIETYMAQTEAYLSEHDRVSSLACVNTLDMLFRYLAKDYLIRPENIF